MKALVEPATEPYTETIPETCWGRWIRNHLDDMIAAGWTLIEDYEPPTPVPPGQ